MNIENLMDFNKVKFKKYFGVLIKSERIKLSLSVEEFSNLLGCSTGEIRRLESGLGKIDQDKFEKICDILHIHKQEVINLFKITQVSYILNLYKFMQEGKDEAIK